MAVEESVDWSCACRTSEESKEVEEESPALMYQSCITMSLTPTDASKQPGTARKVLARQLITTVTRVSLIDIVTSQLLEGSLRRI